MTDINLTEKALGRIIWQYRNGAKFREWVSILPDIASDELLEPANQIARLVNVDTATGEELNICGRIAQIERPVIPEPDLESVFYLTDIADGAPQLGDTDVQMVSLDSAIPVDVQDDLYRRLIRAKISVNTSDATIDRIASALAIAAGLDAGSVRVNDYQDMTYDVTFLEELDPLLRYILANYPVSPRPQGVKLLGYVEEPFFMQLGGAWQLGDEQAQLNSVYI